MVRQGAGQRARQLAARLWLSYGWVLAFAVLGLAPLIVWLLR